MTETITDLNIIHAKMNELQDLLKAAHEKHHLIDQTGNDRDDMSELDYLRDALDSAEVDGIVPLKALQGDDEQDDDGSDFAYEVRRDDEKLAA